MYGILAIHEVLHTIRLRGYEEGMASCHTHAALDTNNIVCICMASLPYTKFAYN